MDGGIWNEVEREHKKRQIVSEDEEHITAEKRYGDEEEKDDNHQQPMQSRLHAVFRVAAVRTSVLSAWCISALAVDVVPGEVECKQRWE